MVRNYVSNKDETVRMFNNDFLEALSRVHPAVPLIIFVPVIAFFLYQSFFDFDVSFDEIILYYFFGLIIWTATEYLLHRFVFHYEPNSEFGKKVHFIFHGVHHDYPNDSRRLVMPPSVSIPLATLFYYLFLTLIGEVRVTPFFAGFLTGYLIYDMTHYAVHHFTLKSKFWLALKKHHMKHHYQDSSNGFGVSNTFWDHVAGTTFNNSKN